MGGGGRGRGPVKVLGDPALPHLEFVNLPHTEKTSVAAISLLVHTSGSVLEGVEGLV